MRSPKTVTKMIIYQSLKQDKEPSLIDINLSYNYIKSGFVDELRSALKFNKKVKNINLRNNILNQKSI